MSHVFTHSKRLLVLGAGTNQLPLIIRAKSRGLYVITADYLPDNLGHQYSDASLNCSTTNVDGILEAAGALAIDGITTIASDVAVTTVARVASALHLAGPNPNAAETMTNKALFREFQARSNLNGPRFVAGTEITELAGQAVSLNPPLFVKPVDTSGSRGVTIIQDPAYAKLHNAIRSAIQFSRINMACIEESIPGIDSSADGLLYRGKVVFMVATTKHTDGPIITGHQLPTQFTPSQLQAAQSVIERHCTALGYYDGPFDCDLRIDGDSVFIIEISPRLGGNAIPQLIEHATGSDLLGSCIDFALGCSTFSFGLRDHVEAPCGSIVFGSPCDGILDHVTPESELIQYAPDVLYAALSARPGQLVQRFSHGGSSLGYALFRIPRSSTYTDVAAHVAASLAVRIRTASDEHVCQQ